LTAHGEELLVISFARLGRSRERVLDMDQAPLAAAPAMNLHFRRMKGKWHSMVALFGYEIGSELRPHKITGGVDRNRIKCQLPFRTGALNQAY
jgi:hypothetical protein